jgi:hypothetical protein
MQPARSNAARHTRASGPRQIGREKAVCDTVQNATKKTNALSWNHLMLSTPKIITFKATDACIFCHISLNIGVQYPI